MRGPNHQFGTPVPAATRNSVPYTRVDGRPPHASSSSSIFICTTAQLHDGGAGAEAVGTITAHCHWRYLYLQVPPVLQVCLLGVFMVVYLILKSTVDVLLRKYAPPTFPVGALAGGTWRRTLAAGRSDR